MGIRVYVQSEHLSDVKMLEIDPDATVEQLQRAALALMPPGSDTAGLSLSVEDDEGDEARADTPVRHLQTEHGVRVHLHRCKHIDVHVRFGAEEVHCEFRPATTVGRVRSWAGHKFGMRPGDIAEHVLQIVGTNEQPDVDTHIGTLTKCPQCSLAFDLMPAHRING